MLSVAAVVSLALGLFQDFGTHRTPDDGPPVDWVEGVAIVVAILIVVSASDPLFKNQRSNIPSRSLWDQEMIGKRNVNLRS